MKHARAALFRWRLIMVALVVLGGCGASDGERTETPADQPRPAVSTTADQATEGPSAARPSQSQTEEPAGPTGSSHASPRPSASVAVEAATPRPSVTRSWSRLPDAPLALTEVTAAAHDGRLWVAGGLDAHGSAVDAVIVFDPLTGVWSEGPRLPEGVHHAALVSTGSALLLIGGFEGSFPGTPTAAVYRLDVASTAWVESTPLPEPRGAGAAAWDGSRVVFAGGVSGGGVSREVWALEGETWRRIGELSKPRQHLAATSDGTGQTWFLGGRVSALVSNIGTVDLVAGDEVLAMDLELSPRSGGAGFWHPDLGACLAGGEGPAGTHDDVECVSPSNELATLPSLSVARHGPGAAVVGDGVYVVLGGERPGLFVSAVVESLPVPAAAAHVNGQGTVAHRP